MDNYIVRENVKPLHDADSGRHVEIWSCMKFSEENITFTAAVVLQKELSDQDKKKYIDPVNAHFKLLDARTLRIREVTVRWSDLRVKDAEFRDA